MTRPPNPGRLLVLPGHWPIEPDTLEPEPETKPNGSAMAHPFIVGSITIRDSRGEVVKEVNPREWPKYGLEKLS
jgi:hypothetical protein